MAHFGDFGTPPPLVDDVFALLRTRGGRHLTFIKGIEAARDKDPRPPAIRLDADFGAPKGGQGGHSFGRYLQCKTKENGF